MTGRNRVALLGVAVAIAVVAFLALRTGDQSNTDSDRTASPAESAKPAPSETSSDGTPTPTPKPKPKLPLLTGATVRELEVKQGEIVRFAARSPADDEIHVHGYDRSKEAPAGQAVQMSFKATITGIFEIEFEKAGKPIGELKVEP